MQDTRQVIVELLKIMMFDSKFGHMQIISPLRRLDVRFESGYLTISESNKCVMKCMAQIWKDHRHNWSPSFYKGGQVLFNNVVKNIEMLIINDDASGEIVFKDWAKNPTSVAHIIDVYEKRCEFYRHIDALFDELYAH